MFLTSLQYGSRGQTLGGLPNAHTHVLQRIVIKIFILWLKIWPSPRVCHLYKQLHLLPCHLPPDFQTHRRHCSGLHKDETNSTQPQKRRLPGDASSKTQYEFESGGVNSRLYISLFILCLFVAIDKQVSNCDNKCDLRAACC